MLSNPVPWPGGARCAVAITFDIDSDSVLHIDYPDRADNMIATNSWLRYDEVAVPRLLELYRRYELRQTFFYPSWCMERYPALVEAILKDGHEIGQHGYLHENANTLSADEEEYWFARAHETIVRMTGRAPRGHRSPLYNMSKRTPALLARHGFLYDATLMGDDVPYVLSTAEGEVIELPSDWTLDDWPQYAHAPDFHFSMPTRSPDNAMQVFLAEFEAAWTYGGLWIAVWHPFVSGRLSRCMAIERMIRHMQERGGVWFATLEEIASHVASLRAENRWTPRQVGLPYFDGRIAELDEYRQRAGRATE